MQLYSNKSAMMRITAWYKLRQFVYNNLHNEDYETLFSRCINYFLILLIIGNVVAVLLESINPIYKAYHVYFNFFECGFMGK